MHPTGISYLSRPILACYSAIYISSNFNSGGNDSQDSINANILVLKINILEIIYYLVSFVIIFDVPEI
jgi:hypothetical protein